MEFDLTQEFPVSLDRLWTALGRVDYIEQKYRSLGSSSLRMRKFMNDALSIEVELDREAPVAMDQLPLWARVLSGERQPMRHHTRWERVSRDRVDVMLDIRAVGRGVAAAAKGSVRQLSPRRSRMTLHFEVLTTSRAVPPVLAELFARQVTHALEADHAFTLDYLRSDAARQGSA